MRKIQTVAEIEQQYPDEWVLLEIVRDRKHHLKIAGRLITHTRNREDLIEAYRQFRAEHPHARVFQFFTGDIVPKGVTVVLRCHEPTGFPSYLVGGSSPSMPQLATFASC